MPQMAPLSWLILFWFFLIFYFMFNINNYYIFQYITKIKTTSQKSLTYSWKW